jgi:ATP-binding cassette subfamily B protein
MMLVSLAIMFVLSPTLALIGLVIAPALFVVSYRMRLKVFPATWDGQQREGEVAEVVDEDVNGVRVVKAFGQEERELARMVGIVQTLYGVRDARHPAAGVVPTAPRGDPGARPGGRRWPGRVDGVARPDLTRHVPAFSTYVGQFVAPARQLAGVLTVGQQARAGVERIFQLLDLRPQIADAADAADLPEVRGELELRGVRFAYDEQPGARRARPPRGGRRARRPRWAPAAPASRRSPASSTGCSDPDEGQVLVDGHDVRQASPARPCAVRWVRSVRGELPVLRHHRRRTSPTGTRTRRARRSRRRLASPAPTTSSSSWPTATAPGSASVA